MTAAASGTVVRAERLSFSYGRAPALHDLDIETSVGDVVGLVGPNGAGKSTFLRLLVGALPLNQGSLSWFGHPPAPPTPALLRRIGYAPDESPLFDELTGIENVGLIAQLRGAPTRNTGLDVLQMLGLDAHDANRQVASYSFGMRRKVTLARAFVAWPPFIALDEPTIGLDDNARDQLSRVIRERTRASAFVVSTNDLAFAERVCDRIIFLHQGRSVLHGLTTELLRRVETLEVRRSDLRDLFRHVTGADWSSPRVGV